jgi:hypothetical protein
LLARIEQLWWFRILAWLFRFNLEEAEQA